jgi:hypothetical protein
VHHTRTHTHARAPTTHTQPKKKSDDDRSYLTREAALVDMDSGGGRNVTVVPPGRRGGHGWLATG